MVFNNTRVRQIDISLTHVILQFLYIFHFIWSERLIETSILSLGGPYNNPTVTYLSAFNLHPEIVKRMQSIMIKHPTDT